MSSRRNVEMELLFVRSDVSSVFEGDMGSGRLIDKDEGGIKRVLTVTVREQRVSTE